MSTTSEIAMNDSKKNVSPESATKPIIEIVGMHKWFGDFHVLSDINLQVMPQEKIVICGPSGSGKSTLIRCINRLEEHQRGQIIVNGTELSNDIKNIEKVRAEVGMVFQHFNLFPHLTIIDNLTLGPIWVRKTPKKEAEEAAMMYLEKVQIPEQAKKFPGQLSGGQQQRVAIARSLCMNPEVMLFDEPTVGLDAETRKSVSLLIKRLIETGRIVIFASHDTKFAKSTATRNINLEQFLPSRVTA